MRQSHRNVQEESNIAETSGPCTPPRKKQRLRNCIFNQSCLEMDTYKEWLAQGEDPNQACCVLCRTKIICSEI